MSVSRSLACSSIDFVDTDVEALASHMRQCADARGRWFGLRRGMQKACALAGSHIVTTGCVMLVIGFGFFAVA